MQDLKKLLGDELFDQVKEKAGDVKIMVDDGNFIPKARFDEVNEERNALKEELKARDEQLGEIKKQVKDNALLTAKIEQLEDQNKQSVTDYELKLKQQRFIFAVEQALIKADARNERAVKALLDLEKITLGDDGKLIGFDEQVKALQENEPYLFGKTLKGRTPETSKETPATVKNPFSKEHFNLTEQARLIKEDPEKAEKLRLAATGG